MCTEYIWITEINELFHDILIYWDAPVHVETQTGFWQVKLAKVTLESEGHFWGTSCKTNSCEVIPKADQLFLVFVS